MATFKEIIYMVLDLLKENSDDSFYTEEHVLFLASKMRALLLERKYKGSRNTAFTPMSSENEQQICLSLDTAEILPYGCSGLWLKSTEKLPDLLGSTEPKIAAVSDMLGVNISFIPAERMPYVGHNKWLKNIIYAAKSVDDYLYLYSNNPQFRYLENIKMSGVFSNPEEAAKLACSSDGEQPCDVMDQTFPLEDALVPSCIELIVQELTGARYAPEDRQNNDKDDLSDVGLVQRRSPRPAEDIVSTRRMQEAEQ